MGEGAGGRRASTIPCGVHRVAEALGDRAHDRMDHAQPEDEPRLRVLVRDDGGSDLHSDDPTDAQKARHSSLMRASQTPLRTALLSRMRHREVPRIHLPRTPVNKGKEDTHPRGDQRRILCEETLKQYAQEVHKTWCLSDLRRSWGWCSSWSAWSGWCSATRCGWASSTST